MALANNNLADEFEWKGVTNLPELDDQQFIQWVALLKQRTGMRLPPERKSFLVTSLCLRMREIGFSDYQEYFEYVTTPGKGVVEWETLVDRLTVHETRFYRHPPTLEFIQAQLLSRLDKLHADPVSVNAWSIGCATGEEAYTLALLFDQFFEAFPGETYYGVIGSDISTASLATAREGCYDTRKLVNLDNQLLKKYFTPSGKDKYQIEKRIKDRVCFSRINVLDLSRAPQTNMDLIVCQNLLIYFDMKERFKVLESMVEHLVPGGLIILGAGEVLGWEHPQIERIQHTDVLAFRRLTDVSPGGVQ